MRNYFKFCMAVACQADGLNGKLKDDRYKKKFGAAE